MYITMNPSCHLLSPSMWAMISAHLCKAERRIFFPTTLAILLRMSWYLFLDDTCPVCSSVRRFRWIFLFFCSRGSCASSTIDWPCFMSSGVLESKTARFTMSEAWSVSWKGNIKMLIYLWCPDLPGSEAAPEKPISKLKEVLKPRSGGQDHGLFLRGFVAGLWEGITLFFWKTGQWWQAHPEQNSKSWFYG